MIKTVSWGVVDIRTRKTRPKKSKTKKRFLPFFLSFVITLVFILLSATVVSGVFISGSDVIFPNVSAGGINLSGLTLDEAVTRLVSLGFERNAETVSVMVNFPDGSSFSISGYDAGLSLCAEEAAHQAFRHGRDGTFFESIHTYVTSLLEQTNISLVPELDENFVRDEVAAHTRLFNSSLVESPSYSLNGDSITVVLGSSYALADENSVFNLVTSTLHSAFEEGTHLVAYYTIMSDPIFIDLNALHHAIRTEPVSAAWDPETLDVTEHIRGVGFNVLDAMDKLTNARVGEEITIPLVFTEPEVTTEHLRQGLFRDELAYRTTTVSGTAARFTNVTLAASIIDDMVLNPGEIFSFNGTVGRSTETRGFRPAGGFRDGQLVDMVGGGICQVASSLYDNVLHSYLEVVQRRAHSLPITYLPHGHDASIYYGVLDLRFRNNTNYPIRIEIEFDEREMTTRLIGTRTNDHIIRIESNSTVVPFYTVYREDENVEYDQVYFTGRNGFIAYTYRVIYDADENRISRTRISRDVYRAQNRIVLTPSAYAEQPEPSAETGTDYVPGQWSEPAPGFEPEPELETDHQIEPEQIEPEQDFHIFDVF